MNPFRFALDQLGYDLKSGLLFRPAMWIAAFGSVAIILPPVEALFFPEISAWLGAEPSTAQVVLGTLAGSMMTVVSVVYSILLVALSLASMQFSTRILAGMTRDPVSQHTLGLFVGTFVYCLFVLRSVDSNPPFVPGIALTGAIGAALTSLAALVYFIHHIIRSIQANHLVDRIARETEAVIDDVFGNNPPVGTDSPETPIRGSVPVFARSSGYVQLIDIEALRAVALRVSPIDVSRPMGTFAVEGRPVAFLPDGATEADIAAVAAAFDLGPVRTMQKDAEFGLRQIVDIALKAISPAVNDPSTAATCIDHLSRVLVRAARFPPSVDGIAGVFLHPVSHADLVDLSFEQLRQYGKTDMAVALRLLRAMTDVAAAMTNPAARDRLALQARLLESRARTAFPDEDCDELIRRYAQLQVELAGDGGASAVVSR